MWIQMILDLLYFSDQICWHTADKFAYWWCRDDFDKNFMGPIGSQSDIGINESTTFVKAKDCLIILWSVQSPTILKKNIWQQT